MKKIFIKCQCGGDNNIQAKYCAYCGKELPAEDRDSTYYKTPIGFIDKIKSKKEKVKEAIELFTNPIAAIANIKIVRLLLIVILLISSIYLTTNRPRWNKAIIIPTEDYQVEYNRNLYEIKTNKDTVELKLVCLNEIKNVEVNVFSSNEELNLDFLSEDNSNLIINTAKGIEHILIITYIDNSQGNIKFIFK